MKQFERPSNEKGGSPQGEVHSKALIADIIAMLGRAEEWQLRIILRFAKRIIH